ncbi:MAG: oxygenase MpaB family protein [Nocardiaceae bacterium]|nr:oxygenase MpaB family protein [Nocardiaceae bacterium]
MSARKLENSRQAIDVTQGEGSQAPYSDSRTDSQEALVRRLWLGAAVFLAGPANVVMQMSNYPVARGITESKVESGSVLKHPFKRFRTTVGYLDISLFGDDDLRADYRNAINGAHRQIHSTDASPVQYNAFNRHLQLWVASCLYYGFRDMTIGLHGPLTDQEEEDLLQASSRMGTTLQIPAAMWHPNRQAFEAYWADGMRQTHWDDETRAYARDLVNADFFPGAQRLFKVFFGAPLRFFNIGFLPQELRDELGLEWTESDERTFRRLMRLLGTVSRPLPFALRRVPTNWMAWNLRVRRRLGKPMV